MKSILWMLALALLLSSCKSNEEAKESEEQTVTTEVTQQATESEIVLQPIDSDQALMATALMAAPAASRAGCKVIGYNTAGEFVTFKDGNNEFIVLVDDSKRDGFNAACYHKDLEPFMARGRDLRAEGKSPEEIFAIREAEAKSGALKIPTGAALHIYYGPKAEYNPETNEVAGAKLRYVVYMPFATAATTGLPESPVASNHPWIMNPGTHRAHIMISPLPPSDN